MNLELEGARPGPNSVVVRHSDGSPDSTEIRSIFDRVLARDETIAIDEVPVNRYRDTISG